MPTITAKELHNGTSGVLDHVEHGKTIAVSRNGKVIAIIAPAQPGSAANWDEVMRPVWEAQQRAKGTHPNPVLVERARRRR